MPNYFSNFATEKLSESLILGVGYIPLLLTAFSFAFLFFFAFDASSGFASLSEISFPVKENSGSSSPKAISLADACKMSRNGTYSMIGTSVSNLTRLFDSTFNLNKLPLFAEILSRS